MNVPPLLGQEHWELSVESPVLHGVQPRQTMPGKETGDGIPEGDASPADVGAGGGPAGTAWKGVADVIEPLIVFEFK